MALDLGDRLQMPPAHRLRALHRQLAGSEDTALCAQPAAAVDVADDVGVLGWPNLGLPAPEYRHAPRLEPGSAAVNAHLEEHGFVSQHSAAVVGTLLIA